jgi:ATP-binding protein involved in chromosome partitioning
MSDSAVDRQQVEDILKDFPDPETGRKLWQLDQVRDLVIEGNAIKVTIGLTSYSSPLWEETREQLVEQLRTKLPTNPAVDVTVVPHNRPVEPIGNIGLTAKSVIAVGSGKGGVGKSTIAVSIACGLKRAGCRVGLLDADVYGPSVPHLLGLDERPQAVDGKLQPIQVDGMPVMSMGFLVPPGEAVVWRGPMLHGAITQFLRDTAWGELDYLIIDMPPGTGDVSLTLSQLLGLAGAVIVCTPQKVALLDAVRAIDMFHQVKIPVLGMVENMTGEIFGRGGAKAQAEQMGVPFLGEVPTEAQIRIQGDEGKISALFEEGNPARGPLLHATERMAIEIARTLLSSPTMPTLEIL